MIKVLALDDQKQQLECLALNIKVYNKKQESDSDMIAFDFETDYKSYIERMDDSYDIALIDIDLKQPDVNGFQVAQQLYEKFGSKLIYIMCSSLVKDNEDYESLLPKTFKNIASELVSRFNELKIHPLENRAQLLFSQDHFSPLAHV